MSLPMVLKSRREGDIEAPLTSTSIAFPIPILVNYAADPNGWELIISCLTPNHTNLDHPCIKEPSVGCRPDPSDEGKMQ